MGGWVDVHALDLVGVEVADLARLIARRQLATDGSASEAGREQLAHLPVGVLDHMLGVRVDPNQRHDIHVDAIWLNAGEQATARAPFIS